MGEDGGCPFHGETSKLVPAYNIIRHFKNRFYWRVFTFVAVEAFFGGGGGVFDEVLVLVLGGGVRLEGL